MVMPRAADRPACRALSIISWMVLLGYLVVDKLLEGVWVGADQAAAVDEECGGASNVEEVAIGEAGVDSRRWLAGC